MIPLSAVYAYTFAKVASAFLLVLGALFLFAPTAGLKFTKHHSEDLSAIMAGRYFFLGFVTLAVALEGSRFLLFLVLVGLAGLAFFDAIVYGVRGKTILPHFLVGFFALIAAAIALEGKGEKVELSKLTSSSNALIVEGGA